MFFLHYNNLVQSLMQRFGGKNAPILRRMFVKLTLDPAKRLCPGGQSGLILFRKILKLLVIMSFGNVIYGNSH
ncbi:MAG: hypothetical protein HUU08_08215 [Candidatus Brocadia sp.]|nr:hypothetical protein [Candidatus Brocadia sp.]